MVEALLEKEIKKKVDKFRLEDELGIRFDSIKELRRAIDFLDNEKLPYELYGYKVVGVYKPVKDYLTIKGFGFKDFEIVDTRYLSDKELREVRLEQEEVRKKAEKRFERVIGKYK